MKRILLTLVMGLLLLAGLFVGCFGIERINPLELYVDEIGAILKEYKSVIDDWGKAASDLTKLHQLDLDAETAYSRMGTVIES